MRRFRNAVLATPIPAVLTWTLAAGCLADATGPSVADPRIAGRFLYSIERDTPDGVGERLLRIARRDGSRIRDARDPGHIYAMRATPTGTVLATICEEDGAPVALVEIDPEGRTSWRYDWPAGQGGISHMRAAHLLPNGRILVSGLVGRFDPETGYFDEAVALELDRRGNVLRSLRLGPLAYLGAVRPLGEDALLVCGEELSEVDWEGNPLRTLSAGEAGGYRDALKLGNGNYLVGTVAGDVRELTPRGDTLWAAPHPLPVALHPLPAGGVLAEG